MKKYLLMAVLVATASGTLRADCRTADLWRDGVINSSDFSSWSILYGDIEGAYHIRLDVNRNGILDDGDQDMLRACMLPGDLNLSGTVDQADLDRVLLNYAYFGWTSLMAVLMNWGARAF